MFEVVLCKCNFLYNIYKAKRTSSLLSLHALHLSNLVTRMPKDGGYILLQMLLITVNSQTLRGEW